MTVIAAIDQTTAALILATIVLLGAIGLTFYAVGKTDRDQKFLAGIIGLMFGLFGAGGIGTVLVSKAADDAANNVKNDVQQQVQDVNKSP